MARPRKTYPKIVESAKQVAHETNNIRELRQAMSILLPSELNATLEQTAQILGIGRSTVPRLQSKFRQRTQATELNQPNWGGRRKSLMSLEEELKFLEPWVEQAKTGGVLVVSPIRAALAQHLGRKVAATIVYRLLARHGWRKVAPDTRHPKNDPKIQEAWKKNSRKTWQPY